MTYAKNYGYSSDTLAKRVWTASTEVKERYVYRDAEGSELFAEEKGFAPGSDEKKLRIVAAGRAARDLYQMGQNPDNAGYEGPRVLYRLPELIASDRGERVFITEGPKDAETLARFGLIATTNAFGALSWEATYSEYLRGRHVVICEDNDETGKQRTKKLKKEIGDIVSSFRVIRFTDLEEKADVTDFFEGGRTLDDFLQVLDCAEDELNTVVLTIGNLHKDIERAAKVLIRSNPDLFLMGGNLVYFNSQRETKPINTGKMQSELSRYCKFYNFDKKGEKKPWGVTKDFAATFIGNADCLPFPVLKGVVHTPTMRPDGSILHKQGFDAETGLYLTESMDFEAIPAKVSRSEALEALALLESLLSGFPFVDDASRSVALSGLITPVVRASLAVAPMHVSSAPTPGTGKSFLWDTVSMIATGNKMAVTSAPKNAEELEKRVHSIMLEGKTIVSIDNVNAELGGDALNQMIERPVVSVRRLGGSDMTDVNNVTTLFATGNNIKLVADTVRRTLLCRLDAKTENPESRQFDFNPVQAVKGDRGIYVRAALMVVKAYRDAGLPDKLPRLASFEEWSDYVRSALVWLGKADPVATQQAVADGDPERELLGRFLSAWKQVGFNSVTTGELKEKAFGLNKTAQESGFEKEHPLWTILKEIAGERELVNSKRLGKYLSRNENRIVSGMTIKSNKDDKLNSKRWTVE